MFSGKTTHLIGRIERHTIVGRRCLIVRHQADTRTNSVISHSGIEFKGEIVVYTDGEISHTMKDISKYDVIGIDEGHFFKDMEEIVKYLLMLNKIVIVSTLNSSYKRLPFNNLSMLYVEADKITKLSAVCYNCKKDAIFTKRKDGFEAVGDVGGQEMYDACCRDCWSIK